MNLYTSFPIDQQQLVDILNNFFTQEDTNLKKYTLTVENLLPVKEQLALLTETKKLDANNELGTPYGDQQLQDIKTIFDNAIRSTPIQVNQLSTNITTAYQDFLNQTTNATDITTLTLIAQKVSSYIDTVNTPKNGFCNNGNFNIVLNGSTICQTDGGLYTSLW